MKEGQSSVSAFTVGRPPAVEGRAAAPRPHPQPAWARWYKRKIEQCAGTIGHPHNRACLSNACCLCLLKGCAAIVAALAMQWSLPLLAAPYDVSLVP